MLDHVDLISLSDSLGIENLLRSSSNHVHFNHLFWFTDNIEFLIDRGDENLLNSLRSIDTKSDNTIVILDNETPLNCVFNWGLNHLHSPDLCVLVGEDFVLVWLLLLDVVLHFWSWVVNQILGE